jgi:hypothetical protein
VKNSILKIFVALTLVSFFGIGVSFADSWKNESGTRGYEHKDKGRDRDDDRMLPSGLIRSNFPD